ncbi:Peroxiredoxin Q, chloroplastic [Tetrabaena socialis]|uniref:thioredoxin-dependent peroxiredoxin n=1 Tax=Tetrabaena socialis TaxID=47790 RepID=A0A2J8A7B0_9CHLO|nr:Peroxiredoxin Q, chloroplastic [Tetrabaena socialis]|eukprot:PNH08419.1 Peroxiredoxin Q, chloroplastic [Tetrabaena socialis]
MLRAPAATRPAFRSVQRKPFVVKAELKVGQKLEEFPDYYRVIKSSQGGSVSLSSYKGKQPVVLFFYPKAATPGCTKEACRFRDEYSRFVSAGAAVFGISSDSPEDNAAFAKANNLPYPLLTDQNALLRKAFGIKADLLGLLPGRQTYVVDVGGRCVLSFNDQFGVEAHVDEALKALKANAAA